MPRTVAATGTFVLTSVVLGMFFDLMGWRSPLNGFILIFASGAIAAVVLKEMAPPPIHDSDDPS